MMIEIVKRKERGRKERDDDIFLEGSPIRKFFDMKGSGDENGAILKRAGSFKG